MSVALHLILSTTLVAAPPGCSWAHPGANPYRGDPVAALADFDLPEPTRAKLRALMAAHRTTDVAVITRDDIVGAHGYTDLREMHSGGGVVCHGTVDRSAWSPQRRERGLVYCADDACVIVPTICNNVSLVSRKPDRPVVLDDEPIDIEPAAGPPAAATPPPASAPGDTALPLDFLPPTDTWPTVPDAPEGGGGPGGGSPGLPPGGGGGVPIIGGGGPCCEGTLPPGFPGTPTTPGGGGGGGGVTVPPPTSPVPETPAGLMLLAALAALRLIARRG